MTEKTVLVKIQTPTGYRNRPVRFTGGKEELLRATMVAFCDILTSNEPNNVYLQILDETWGNGVFVDLLDQDIPPRSVLLAVEKVSFINNDVRYRVKTLSALTECLVLSIINTLGFIK